MKVCCQSKSRGLISDGKAEATYRMSLGLVNRASAASSRLRMTRYCHGRLSWVEMSRASSRFELHDFGGQDRYVFSQARVRKSGFAAMVCLHMARRFNMNRLARYGSHPLHTSSPSNQAPSLAVVVGMSAHGDTYVMPLEGEGASSKYVLLAY